MISMPRDARVEIPPFSQTNFPGDTGEDQLSVLVRRQDGRTGPSVWDRQPDLSPDGRGRGAALTMLTISNLVPGGLKFNGAAIIDFKGFEAVVSALGGVYMCIDTDLYSIHYYPNGQGPAILCTRTTEGVTAPASTTRRGSVVTCSRGRPSTTRGSEYDLPNGDYDRQRHQQQLLKAIVKKVASTDTLANFRRSRSCKDAAGDLLTLSLGGNKLEDWVLTLSSLRADDMMLIRTNGGKYSPIGDGTSDERLMPETLELLKSVQTDTVFDFLNTHQDWVAPDQ